jgi:hypothetical protein
MFGRFWALKGWMRRRKRLREDSICLLYAGFAEEKGD